MKLKRISIFVLFIVALFVLVGCKSAEEYGLSGFNKIWYPINVWWDWQWNRFTPNFWKKIETVWTALPASIAWLAGIISNILSAVLYLIIIIILSVCLIIAAVVCGIVWFFVGVFYGFYQWDGQGV